jgi:hypothetical protein
VVAPLAREIPSSSTRTFEEIVNATERRISDSINTKMSEMSNLVKDLERQIVLLREDLATKESTVTPGDRDASGWDDGWWQQDEGWWHPAPYSNNEDGWNWSYPVSWDDADWDAWTRPATADFTGGTQRATADSTRKDQWSFAWDRAKATNQAQQQ